MPNLRSLLRDIYGVEPQNQDKRYTQIDQQQGSIINASTWGALSSIGMTRLQRYRDFDDMDQRCVEVNTALDIYADDATPLDANRQRTIWATSKNNAVVELVEELFERIDVEEIIWGIARDTAKYGESIKFVPQIRLSEAERGTQKPADLRDGIKALEDVDQLRVQANILHGVIKDYTVDDKKNDPWDPWDFFHARLRGRTSTRGLDAFLGAHSMLESARPIWRMLNVLETSLAMTRLSRGPVRNVFYLDTTGLSIVETVEATNQYRARFRRNSYVRPDTGEFDSTVSPMVEAEDIYWPVKSGMKHSVDTIGGGIDVRAIEDIKYYRDKMLMSLKIPREFLAFEGGGGLINTSLSIKDAKFARSIRKLQRAVISSFIRLIQVEMILRGFDPMKDENEFELHMGIISMVEELQKIEVLKEAASMAESLAAVGISLGRQADPVWNSTMLRTVYGFIARSMGIPELLEVDTVPPDEISGPAPSNVPITVDRTVLPSATAVVGELSKLAGPEDKHFVERLERYFRQSSSTSSHSMSSQEQDTPLRKSPSRQQRALPEQESTEDPEKS